MKVEQAICDRCGTMIKGTWEDTCFRSFVMEFERPSQATFPLVQGAGTLNTKYCTSPGKLKEARENLTFISKASGQHFTIAGGKEHDFDLCNECKDDLIWYLGKFFSQDIHNEHLLNFPVDQRRKKLNSKLNIKRNE